MDEAGCQRRGVRIAKWCGVLLTMVLAMTGCASDYEAPIEQKPALPNATRPSRASTSRAADDAPLERNEATPAVHVVASGDKLLTIAWRYGLDVRDLVRWNQISNPDLIVVGQTLRLRPPAPPRPAPARVVQAPVPASAGTPLVSGAGSAPATPPPPLSRPAPRINMAPLTAPPSAAVVTAPATAAATNSAPTAPRAAAATPDMNADKAASSSATAAATNGADSGSIAAANKAGVRWMWPTQGKVSAADAGAASKGIDIRGTRGQAVKAAAGGTVVYSGSGLRGYGELIIIQHNDTFLSAYAHNEARMVQEGRHVDAGETIARMGNSDTTDVMLHFEIRRNGKAVDPLQYLPNR